MLDINVANYVERGLLGIAIAGTNPPRDDKDNGQTANVFLYFTEASNEGQCLVTRNKETDCNAENILGHRLYKYELIDNRLTNPKLILDIPENPGSSHIGGVLAISHDENVYLITGDGESCFDNSCKIGVENSTLNTQSANAREGHLPEGRGGILRVTQEGEIVNCKGILGN